MKRTIAKEELKAEVEKIEKSISVLMDRVETLRQCLVGTAQRLFTEEMLERISRRDAAIERTTRYIERITDDIDASPLASK